MTHARRFVIRRAEERNELFVPSAKRDSKRDYRSLLERDA